MRNFNGAHVVGKWKLKVDFVVRKLWIGGLYALFAAGVCKEKKEDFFSLNFTS